jgi:predicted ester cyclase
MKKFFFAASAAFCCLLFSCNNSSTASSETKEDGNSQAEKNMKANRDVYSGIETGDSSKFAAIADNAVDHGDPSGREMHNGDSIRRMLSDMHNHFDNFKVEVVNDAANGDYVYTWNKMSGTVKDNYMGMAKDAKINMTTVDVVRFQDGKIVEHWSFMDPKDMMQMGQPPMNDMSNGNMNKMDSTKK